MLGQQTPSSHGSVQFVYVINLVSLFVYFNSNADLTDYVSDYDHARFYFEWKNVNDFI